MRSVIIGLLGMQIAGLLLLFTPLAFAPSTARILGHFITLGICVYVSWGIAGIAPTRPRIALLFLRVALVISLFETGNVVLAF